MNNQGRPTPRVLCCAAIAGENSLHAPAAFAHMCVCVGGTQGVGLCSPILMLGERYSLCSANVLKRAGGWSCRFMALSEHRSEELFEATNYRLTTSTRQEWDYVVADGVLSYTVDRCRVRPLTPDAIHPRICWHPLSIPIETPADGRGGCGRMTVSLTA